MRCVDLRSDTITKPTLEMRNYMIKAEVGDDVYGEDPTIKQLEEKAANIMGKEAALFVTSGTMGNQIAVLCHTQRGEAIILEKKSHIYNYEVGGIALLSSVIPHLIDGKDGKIAPKDLKDAIKDPDIHYAHQSLLCLENTHNMAGGIVSTASEIKELSQIAHDKGLNVHLDGARIFNAATYLNVPVSELAQSVDSVMFCLSKGLGAPVGSMLVGNKDFIEKARKYRKLLGGGIRQGGILAAAGLYALENNMDKLKIDHQNAKKLAEGINELKDLKVDIENAHTNIIMVDILKDDLCSKDLVDSLKAKGVLTSAITDKRIRLVTNLDVSEKDIDYTLEVIKDIIK